MKEIAVNEARMNSLEIAELVGSRQTDIKRSIERLIAKGIIRQTPTAFLERINNLGFMVKDEVYVFEGEQGKRDSKDAVKEACHKIQVALFGMSLVEEGEE